MAKLATTNSIVQVASRMAETQDWTLLGKWILVNTGPGTV
jgi:hypothetical protein